jgi:transcriptional regulator with XRE-family HTH domain
MLAVVKRWQITLVTAKVSTMPPRKALPRIDQVLGRNLERLRKEKGWSQDDLVSRGWQVGLPWSRSTIAALEGGRRSVELGEVVLVALVLDSSVAELLAGDDLATVGDGTRMALEQVRQVLMSTPRSAQTHFPGIFRRVSRVHGQDKFSRVMLSANGEAEQKAARSLGITPKMLAQAAYDLWGRSLTEERNVQVDELTADGTSSARQVQALRGHVTRRLLDEIDNLVSSNPDLYEMEVEEG